MEPNCIGVTQKGDVVIWWEIEGKRCHFEYVAFPPPDSESVIFRIPNPLPEIRERTLEELTGEHQWENPYQDEPSSSGAWHL